MNKKISGKQMSKTLSIFGMTICVIAIIMELVAGGNNYIALVVILLANFTIYISTYSMLKKENEEEKYNELKKKEQVINDLINKK